MALAAAAVGVGLGMRSQPVLLEREHYPKMLWLSVLFAAQISIFNLGVNFTSPAYAVIFAEREPRDGQFDQPLFRR